MGVKTGIEWTDTTWNPIRGCSRVSEGCRNCYAEATAHRFGSEGQPYEGLTQIVNGHAVWTGDVRFVEEHLLDPLKWKPVVEHFQSCKFGWQTHNKQCDCPTRPRRIFVNSMSDLFHENVTDEMRDKIFAVMALCPQHSFQVLTKRPERMLAYRTADRVWHRIKLAQEQIARELKVAINYRAHRSGDWLHHIWLGVSVENQKTADERIPLLLQTPAAVRFISAEPLLGSVDVTAYMRNRLPGDSPQWKRGSGLDWVICGGESGPGARSMDAEWAKSLRDQCAAAGVPFFFKQWGEHLPSMQEGAKDHPKGQPLNCSDQPVRVGKKAAGALLGGVEYKQFPETRL